MVKGGEVGASDPVFHGAGFFVECAGLGEISVAAACLLEHHREVVASSGVSEVTGVLEIDASVGRQAFFVEQSTFVASGGFFE